MNLHFASTAQKQCRPALEALLFFNPRRHRVRKGIVNSLDHFGHPRLEETGDNLTVRVGSQEAQTLFVFDQDRPAGDPVAVVVFLRASPDEIAIMHIAVHQDYGLKGRHGGPGLGLS